MKPIYPLPEAIDGNRWSVERGSGSCNTVDREMLVPLGATSADRHVRNHELAHAFLTPRVAASKQCIKYGITMDAMQVCEDLRVHRFLQSKGIDRSGVLTPVEMKELVARAFGNARTLAALLVASLYTDDHERAVEAIRLSVDTPLFHQLLDGVRLIDKRMSAARSLFRPIGFKNATVPCSRLFDALFPKENIGGELAGNGRIPLAMPQGRNGSRTVKWGTLTIQKLPATVMRSVARSARGSTYTDEGAMLSAPYRVCADGQVFRRYRPARGGTVLIDASGSMSLSREDLDSILLIAPAATVALYSGSGNSGTLSIIGYKGRIADKTGLAIARSSGNGNIVDGPALEWLATQPSPRCWVSDGLVTGAHDKASIDLAAEAQVICHRAGIVRVEKTATASEYLGGRFSFRKQA